MAFESLSNKLQEVFKQLKSKGKLTEGDVSLAMREIKLALLEADVNYKVVKDFIKAIKERSIGSDVLESLTPGQQVIKIVNDELVALLGTTQSKLTFSNKTQTVFMMVGLQGAGKTTTTAKLAGQLKKDGKKPLLVGCDVYRPAAVKQLETLGKKFDIPVFSIEGSKSPIEIAKKSLEYAKQFNLNVIILDTAGRLHIDEELMSELESIKKEVRPQEILLVIDAMTGQDSVTVAKSFDDKLGLDGIIITKLDGDARGGSALSVKSITGKPIKYVGVGEKLEDLEVFHPERMASRILGMGDVLSLIEKAQTNIDEKEMLEMEKRLRTDQFTFDDFLMQMEQVKKMGPIKDILGMIPGMGSKVNLSDVDIDDKALIHVEAIVKSMTKKERSNPEIINGPRRKRIAKGSGRNIQEVNRLLKQFKDMKKMMKQFSGMKSGRKGKMQMPFF